MGTDESFFLFLERVRAGDPAASMQLVRDYEPMIRRAIRLKLTQWGLHRLYDAEDISQSVLANFFARARQGQFDLPQPKDLANLLLAMARHQLSDNARHLWSEYHVARHSDDPNALARIVALHPDPTETVEQTDLLRQIRRMVSGEEWRLMCCWARGYAWTEISRRLGRPPEPLRQKLIRVLRRIRSQFVRD